MHKLFLSLSLSLAAAAPAFAATNAPLLSKSNYPGFIAPDYVRTERCDVYADKVVITRDFGSPSDFGFTTKEERAVSFAGNLAQVIEHAAAEEVKETENSLCDGPSTVVSANKGADDAVVLFSTGGCGSPRKERTGPAASMLRDLVDTYCPKTYDFVIQN